MKACLSSSTPGTHELSPAFSESKSVSRLGMLESALEDFV